jgi:hypothetical protein
VFNTVMDEMLGIWEEQDCQTPETVVLADYIVI